MPNHYWISTWTTKKVIRRHAKTAIFEIQTGKQSYHFLRVKIGRINSLEIFASSKPRLRRISSFLHVFHCHTLKAFYGIRWQKNHNYFKIHIEQTCYCNFYQLQSSTKIQNSSTESRYLIHNSIHMLKLRGHQSQTARERAVDFMMPQTEKPDEKGGVPEEKY